MSNSTAGRLAFSDFANTADLFRANGAAISGAPNHRLAHAADALRTRGAAFSAGETVPALVALNVGPYPQGYAGKYKLAGTTTKGGVAVQRTVSVYPHLTPSLCIACGCSDVTGNFVFNNIAAGRYLVIGLSPNGDEADPMFIYVNAIPMP